MQLHRQHKHSRPHALPWEPGGSPQPRCNMMQQRARLTHANRSVPPAPSRVINSLDAPQPPSSPQPPALCGPQLPPLLPLPSPSPPLGGLSAKPPSPLATSVYTRTRALQPPRPPCPLTAALPPPGRAPECPSPLAAGQSVRSRPHSHPPRPCPSHSRFVASRQCSRTPFCACMRFSASWNATL